MQSTSQGKSGSLRFFLDFLVGAIACPTLDVVGAGVGGAVAVGGGA